MAAAIVQAPAAGITGRGVSGVPAPLPEDLFGAPVPTAAPQPAAPAFPSIPVFNTDGITITFAFSKPAGNPQVTDIEATFVNAGLAPVTDFSLQVRHHLRSLLRPSVWGRGHMEGCGRLCRVF